MGLGELSNVNLADPQTFLANDLHKLWQVLRSEAPAYWNSPRSQVPGFWAITRYDDIMRVYLDSVNFTSTGGNVLTTLLRGGDSAAGKMLAVADGRRHREIRNLMLQSFTPRALAPVLEKVRRRTRKLIVQAVEKESVDFAVEIACHLPINTIGDLMNIPDSDRGQLSEWNTLALARDKPGGDDLDELFARNEILMYFADLAQQRRDNPGDDVVSALVHGTIDGKKLSEDEIVLNCYSLILGADQSSRMSSIGGALALAENPDQWRALTDGSVGLQTATEEILRWTTPAMHIGRRALHPTEIAGQAIAANDIVTLWNISANLDEAQFDEPARLDLRRKPNKHIAFGHGAHFCLGSFLGRAHLDAVLGSMRELVESIEVVESPRRLHSNFVFGYTRAPMRLTAASGVRR